MITTRARAGSSILRGGKPLLEVGWLDGGLQPLEVRSRVRTEIDVERGDVRLQHTPRGLAHIGQHAHQFQRRPRARVGRPAKVGAQQALLGVGVEAVVDREVAEVEQTVAHARVLPVDQQHAPAIWLANDVLSKQVVVTGTRIVKRKHAGDSPRHRNRVCELLARLGVARAQHARVVLEQLGHPEAVTELDTAVVESAQHTPDLAGAYCDLPGRERATWHIARHQTARQRCGDGRRDSQLRGAVVGLTLGLAVDAEQLRARPMQAHDELLVPQPHAVVAVGDATVQRLRFTASRTELGLQPLQDVVQVTHSRLARARRAQGGLYRGSHGDSVAGGLLSEQTELQIADLDIASARRAIAGSALHTPVVRCGDVQQLAGTAAVLKAECLQTTGSFKLRGALNKLTALGEDARAGVVTASAGNHGRAVAYAACARGVPCDVFMPADAAVLKVAGVEELGARVHSAGTSVDEALEHASAFALRTGASFVHPFDDLDVIAGQATLGHELLEDVPDLARVIVPVGGGGLASGIGIALRQAGSEAELIGVQARVCAPVPNALEGRSVDGLTTATVADGIAVKRPGSITLPLLRDLLDGIETVSEDEIAAAMVLLAERCKLVAEGAGAVALAALLRGELPARDGATAVIVSGGNVDSGLLASLLLRHETEEGRRVRLFTRVADRPGGLVELLSLIARERANVLSVEHLREAVRLGVRETGVELTLQTRGPRHTAELLAALRDAGYDVHDE
jgi:threonine dehydratase